MEGHRDCVVHGPLNLINMLDFWRDCKEGGDQKVPSSIRYRAMSPLYVGERYRLCMERVIDEDGDGKWEAEIWDSFGRVGMRGAIVD